MESLAAQIKTIDEREASADRRWVKLRRFQYVAQSIAMAANLPLAADENTIAHYKKLVEAEHCTLKR